jgi:hypothetical protein
LWIDLANLWNKSSAETAFLVCYHTPRDIIDGYKFDVELVTQASTSMHGSKEVHSVYVYRRQAKNHGNVRPTDFKSTHIDVMGVRVVCDPRFAEAWGVVHSGQQLLLEYVKQSMSATSAARKRKPTTGTSKFVER